MSDAAASHNVRWLLPGPEAELHRTLVALDPEAGGLAMRRAVTAALLVDDLSLDQLRVVERSLAAAGGEVVRAEEGGRALLLGPRNALGAVAPALRDFSDRAPFAELAAAIEQALLALGRPPPALAWGGERWLFGARTYVLGIVNVTPDSFSGDGIAGDPDRAVAHARRLVAEGADAIDVGGESTRPGHRPVAAAEELERVVPVVERLAGTLGVPISVDTSKAVVAGAALAAGADAVNDVHGLLFDPGLAGVVARAGAAVFCMHDGEGIPPGDPVGVVLAGLRRSLAAAAAAGVPPERCVVDPGIGFGKDTGQNLALLRRLDELRALGRPILVGTSRKSHIGAVLGGRPAQGRLLGTAATVAWAAAHGADIVRVHDVSAMRDVCRVVDAIRAGGADGGEGGSRGARPE